MCEIWKDIPGYEGLYQVSDLGRVKSLERWQYNPLCKNNEQYISEKIKKQSERKQKGKIQSYLTVNLYKNNVGKSFYVHRLVAQAFIPNPENKETVNHINGDKHDNRAVNLEWNTYTENNNHAYITGLNDEKHRRNCKGSFPVLQYDLNMNLIATYPSMREAERKTGVDCASISLAIKKGWKYGGYIWKATNERKNN